MNGTEGGQKENKYAVYPSRNLDNKPTLEEIKKTIKTLKDNKWSGIDEIQAKLFEVWGTNIRT